MAGVFSSQEDVIPKEKRESIFDRVGRELTKKPEFVPDHAPIVALFTGDDGTGKSGTALQMVDEIDIEADEKVVLVDLDGGNLPGCLAYHRKAYKDGNIILKDPTVMTDDRDDVRVDYKATMKEIKAIGAWIKQNYEEHKIRVVILDGMSKLLKWAEYQMRIEKAVDVSGGVTQRYWVNRNKAFLDIVELYKSIPIDTIFIGHTDFNVAPGDKDVSAIKKNMNDQVFQKVSFTVEEGVDGKVKFFAKIDKSKQNLRNKGARVCFAEVDTTDKGKGYIWNPKEVLDLLKPESTEGD
jgi:hypothetical protein